MKFLSATTFASAVLLPAVYADFDVYIVSVGGSGIAGNSRGYQVYDGEANCDNSLDWLWVTRKDVSGDKYGVRCESEDEDACFGSGDPTRIDVLEFNFNSDDFHWTVYAGRDWGLFDLDNEKVGSCEAVSKGNEIWCGNTIGRTEGQHILRCKIDSTNAGDINDNRPV